VSAVLMFAGPTLHRARAIAPNLSLDGVTVVPPVQRGVLPHLWKRPPGVLVIVDGLFHQTLSVGHAELRTTMNVGWQVWGLSSMGAIRAREMQHMGMHGFGRVFGLYCQQDVDFRDDEVTMLHGSEPPYREMSEPLCHLRLGLDEVVARDVIDRGTADEILHELSTMWYGDRTLAWFEMRLRARAPAKRAEIEEIVRGFDRHRIKAHDLIAFLDERPWTRT
jgi:hypothetical protein